MKIEELQFFGPRQKISVSANRLPHWQQEGGIYFVTFRLGDAIPQERLVRWRCEKEFWLRPIQDHGRKRKHANTSSGLSLSSTAGSMSEAVRAFYETPAAQRWWRAHYDTLTEYATNTFPG